MFDYNFDESIMLDNEEVNPKDTESVNIARQLVNARKELADLRESVETKENKVKFLRHKAEVIRTEAQEKINKLSVRSSEIEAQIYPTRREIVAKSREIESLERQLKLALQNFQATEDYKTKSLSFDDITAGLHWREWALDHQITGAKTISVNRRALLGDKRGLGKTLTSLIAADMLQAERILIVVPGDVLRTFEREVEHWAPHRNVWPMGKMPKVARDMVMGLLKTQKQFVVTLNYEAWRKDKTLIPDLIDLHFDTIIIDEAHSIKNASTAAFKGIKRIVLAENVCPRCSGGTKQENVPGDKYSYFITCINCNWDSMSDRDYTMLDRCSIKNVVPMTGSPILNKPQDLFPLLHLIDPMEFAEEHMFLEDYCQQNKWTDKWEFRYGGLDRLAERLGYRFIARDRDTAGVVIPKQTVQYHEIDFDPIAYPKQWRVIQDLTKHGVILLDSGRLIKMAAVIALITRKRQANVWPGGIQLKDDEGNVVFSVGEEVTESLKMDKAIELIEQFREEGSRVALFSQFRVPLDELARRLNASGIRTAVYHGGTSDSTRDEIVVDFDRKYCDQAGYEKKWDVVLCNFKTGGVGVNFTGATETIILDEEWNPGKNDQAYGRTDRMGQTEETGVHVLRINNSIDTWMAELNDSKAKLIGGFEDNMGLAQQIRDAIQKGEI